MEIERPDLVEPVRCHESPTHARRNAATPGHVQTVGVIHAVDPFVVPAVAVKAQPAIALPALLRPYPIPDVRRTISRPLCDTDARGLTDARSLRSDERSTSPKSVIHIAGIGDPLQRIAHHATVELLLVFADADSVSCHFL